jgi:mxaA protein
MRTRNRAFTAWLRHLSLAVAAALVILVAVADAAPASVAIVEQPRSFGHFIGDRLQQRILLEVQGDALEPAGLPEPERLGVWVERLSSRMESDPAGRRWLIVNYQIINAAPTLTTIRLPAWQLKGAKTINGNAELLSIAAWSIHVAPLAPTAAVTAETLRPDRPAPPIATAPIVQGLQLSLGALLLTLLAWLGWVLWRNRQAAAQQPFACAQRQLRGLGAGDAAAWHVLHRAFERSAGRALQRSSLETLFQAEPHLTAMRAEIEDFFARSEAFFFATGMAPAPIDIHGLCKKLRQLERRHEG